MCPTRPSQAPSLPYLHGFHERERERFRRARDAANTATAPATSSIYEYSAAGRGRPLFLFPQLQLRTGRTGSCCSSSATTSPPPATLLQKQKITYPQQWTPGPCAPAQRIQKPCLFPLCACIGCVVSRALPFGSTSAKQQEAAAAAAGARGNISSQPFPYQGVGFGLFRSVRLGQSLSVQQETLLVYTCKAVVCPPRSDFV
jgi:hypothetical protein